MSLGERGLYDVVYAGLSSAGVETTKSILIWPSAAPRNAASSVFEFKFTDCMNFARTCDAVYLSVNLRLPKHYGLSGYELLKDPGFEQCVVEKAELLVDGMPVQTLYGDHMHMEREFMDTSSTKHTKGRRTGMTIPDAVRQSAADGKPRRHYTELPFFFCVPPSPGINVTLLCKSSLRVTLRPLKELVRYISTTGAPGSMEFARHWGEPDVVEVRLLVMSKIDGARNENVPPPASYKTVARIAEPVHNENNRKLLFPSNGAPLRVQLPVPDRPLSHVVWAAREVVDASLYNTGSDGGVAGGVKSLWGTPLQVASALADPMRAADWNFAYEGAADGDEYGAAVAMSSDGRHVVVGASSASTEGQVTEFVLSASNVWEAGTPIDPPSFITGEFGKFVALSANALVLVAYAEPSSGGASLTYTRAAVGDAWTYQSTGYLTFGGPVALNATGSRLVVGTANGTGCRAYYWAGTSSWVLITQLDAGVSDAADKYKSNVAIDDSGDTVVVGFEDYGDPDLYGRSMVFTYDSGTSAYVLQSTITSDIAASRSGAAVAISGNGQAIAIGAPGTAAGDPLVNRGSVRTFALVAGAWAEDAGSKTGAAAADSLGASLALSYDGAVLAAGRSVTTHASGSTLYVYHRGETASGPAYVLAPATGIDPGFVAASSSHAATPVAVSSAGFMVATGLQTHQANGTTPGRLAILTLGPSSHDLNSPRAGSTALSAFSAGSLAAGVSASLRSHTDARAWRADGLLGSLAFPGDRHEYRACDESGFEVEPVKSMQFYINSVERIDNRTKTPYFRLVQADQHAPNVPRKGVYLYSFAKFPFSASRTGFLGFSKRADADVHEIVLTHGATHAPTELLMYASYYTVVTVTGCGVRI